jgi:uncharacterized protein YjbI with pentapeptide repeats
MRLARTSTLWFNHQRVFLFVGTGYHVASKEEEINQLIGMMWKESNIRNNNSALEAVKILRQKGWLEDSSLNDINLSHANLRFADLRGANLRGVDLFRADLSGANFSSANLEGAGLFSANLERTRFFRANLQGANLGETNLTATDLGEANLTAAELHWANLIDAKCDQTIFTRALLDETTFINTDLSTAINLNTVQYRGRITLDLETILTSRGNLPEIFLRRACISENLLSLFTTTSTEFYPCFIVCRDSDHLFARRVTDTLQQYGILCWIDENPVPHGGAIYEEIDRGIRYQAKVVLCCSKTSLSDEWWGRYEINEAIYKEQALIKKGTEKLQMMIGLALDDYLFTNDCAENNQETSMIRSRIAGNFNGWEHDNALFEREIEKVIRALRTDGGKAPPPSPKL